jgi:hypothetical protein
MDGNQNTRNKQKRPTHRTLLPVPLMRPRKSDRHQPDTQRHSCAKHVPDVGRREQIVGSDEIALVIRATAPARSPSRRSV